MRRHWHAGWTAETYLEIRRKSASDLPTRWRQNSACSSRVSCCTRRGLGFAKSSTGLTTKGKAAKRHGLRTSRSASRPIAGLDSEEPVLRQRLRQLTLELRESALRFNRRNDERAEVTKHLAKVSVGMALVFGAAIVVCLTLSACAVACRASPLVLLVAGASAGGLGALLSRTTCREMNGCGRSSGNSCDGTCSCVHVSGQLPPFWLQRSCFQRDCCYCRRAAWRRRHTSWSLALVRVSPTGSSSPC